MFDAEPFKINISGDDLDDLERRLNSIRWPSTLDAESWDDGTSLTFLKELMEYWRDRLDWRAVEDQLNELPHFQADIDGLKVHFIHQKGVGPSPFPLVITEPKEAIDSDVQSGATAEFPFDRMTVARFREAFPRARWSDTRKAWFVPGTTASKRISRWLARIEAEADAFADDKGRDAYAFRSVPQRISGIRFRWIQDPDTFFEDGGQRTERGSLFALG